MNYYEVTTKQRFHESEYTLTYCSEDAVPIGSVVKVPIGSRTTIGIIFAKTIKPSFETKPITEVLYPEALTVHHVELMKWLKEYYASPMADVLGLFLPKALRNNPRKTNPPPALNIVRSKEDITLTKEQLAALQTINDSYPSTVIVHGETGSGKTQIYIEVAKQQIQNDKSVILLVPEINLTSQLVAEFQAEFEQVYTTHSRQTDTQRRNIWLDIYTRKEPSIIIGPRSALFMPVHELGSIIIDEFHESTYKQEQTPKYDTVRVAAVLAQQSKAQLLLGSATPPINEYYLAKQTNKPIARLLKSARKNSNSADIKVVDLTESEVRTETWWMSKVLKSSIERRLENNEQILIYLNRRGSARSVLCNECGWSAQCPNCFLPLTFHADTARLHCHICDFNSASPTKCPDCKNIDIVFRSIGTKQIEQDLKKLFPGKRIQRFDGDTSKDQTLDVVYQDIYNGDVDIIIGTQGIVKGLDLPKLTLVAAVQADTGLQIPDFSSTEKTYQLIRQLAGRVGRTPKDSEVILQTYNPDHPAINLATSGDYSSFYEQEISTRQTYLYPPFVYLLKLTVTYASRARAEEAAHDFKHSLNDINGITVLGPTPAFHERSLKRYNWQLVIKTKDRSKLLQIIAILPSNKWRFELDPKDLL